MHGVELVYRAYNYNDNQSSLQLHEQVGHAYSQIVVNLRFHRGTKIGNGGPVLAAKIGPGDQFLRGTDFFVTTPNRICILIYLSEF